MIDLYRNIKQLREDKGLSQDELAKRQDIQADPLLQKLKKVRLIYLEAKSSLLQKL